MSALRANWRALRAKVTPGARMLGVVKANGYGVGLLAAATAAVGLVATALVLGAQTSAADPISLTLNYHCTLPLVGSQSLKVVINTDMPR